MDDTKGFLDEVLDKIVRRYQLKGKLSGTMKLGISLGSKEMAILSNFFGLAPLRVNGKEEVRLHFRFLGGRLPRGGMLPTSPAP